MDAAQVELRVIRRQFAQDFLAIHLEATTGEHAAGDRDPVSQAQICAGGAIGGDIAGVCDCLEPQFGLLDRENGCITWHLAGPPPLGEDHKLPTRYSLRRAGEAGDSHHKSDHLLHGTGASMLDRRKAIALEGSRPNR
ncbi:hypothetical protein SAMN06272759_101295 [Novosphingobium sp. B1]|nr:hypothetical protein SAMN06272759_101295 [Novosphingobium sp. B1]